MLLLFFLHESTHSRGQNNTSKFWKPWKRQYNQSACNSANSVASLNPPSSSLFSIRGMTSSSMEWERRYTHTQERNNSTQTLRCVGMSPTVNSRTIESRQSKMDDGNAVALILLLMAPLLKNDFLFLKKRSPRNKWHDTHGRAIQSQQKCKEKQNKQHHKN